MTEKLVTRGPHTVETYHTDRDCSQLDGSELRPATEEEIEELRLCMYCDPDAVVGGGGQGTGHFDSLKAAAKANQNDREEAGQ